MSIYSDVMDRFVAIQKEAFTCAAFPYSFGWGSDFPYFTNRLGPASYRWDSQDVQYEDRIIVSRLVVGHITEGYDGEPEDNLYTYAALWIDSIGCRSLLTSTTYPDPLAELAPEPKLMISDTGLIQFNDYAIQHIQVGVEFQTQITLIRQHLPS